MKLMVLPQRLLFLLCQEGITDIVHQKPAHMRTLLLLMAATFFFSCSKKSKNGEGDGCGESPYIPPTAYSIPIWHPGGQIFAFSYIPIAGIKSTPCRSKIYEIKNDSVGLYFMKKDGSGLTKTNDYPFRGATWSQDGTKFAWIEDGNAYLSDFNAGNLVTSNKKLIFQGTMTGNPIFNGTGDSVYLYTLLQGVPAIRRVAIDGSGFKEIKQGSFREIILAPNNRLYYTNTPNEIWSVDKNGNDAKLELAATPANDFRTSIAYYNGNIYYTTDGKILRTGSNIPLVDSKVTSFGISPQGEIIYNQFDYRVSEDNKQNGTFWIMNADGSNKRQITFNHF